MSTVAFLLLRHSIFSESSEPSKCGFSKWQFVELEDLGQTLNRRKSRVNAVRFPNNRR